MLSCFFTKPISCWVYCFYILLLAFNGVKKLSTFIKDVEQKCIANFFAIVVNRREILQIA